MCSTLFKVKGHKSLVKMIEKMKVKRLRGEKMGAAFSSSLGLHSLIMGVAIKEQHTQQELRQP